MAGEGGAQEHQVGLCGTAQRSCAVAALNWPIDAQDRASTDAKSLSAKSLYRDGALSPSGHDS